MKKLLCLAIFCMAIMANATEKKEIAINTTDEKEVLTNDSSETLINNSIEIDSVDLDFEKETYDDDFFGCGSQGNAYYDDLVAGGMSHRDARAERRDWVRDCRGHPNGWISFVLTFGFY